MSVRPIFLYPSNYLSKQKDGIAQIVQVQSTLVRPNANTVAFLSFARCPGCFSLILHRSGKFCSECGESVLTPAKSSSDVTKKLECPRCKKHDLEGELVNQYLINGCRHCGGMWLDHHVLARILDSVKNKFA